MRFRLVLLCLAVFLSRAPFIGTGLLFRSGARAGTNQSINPREAYKKTMSGRRGQRPGGPSMDPNPGSIARCVGSLTRSEWGPRSLSFTLLHKTRQLFFLAAQLSPSEKRGKSSWRCDGQVWPRLGISDPPTLTVGASNQGSMEQGRSFRRKRLPLGAGTCKRGS